MSKYRTHTCNGLTKADVGQEVKLSGWIHNKRDHGGVLFIDLRDHYGLTQVVIYPDSHFIEKLSHLPKESVVQISGKVVARLVENINSNLPTGEIELAASGYELLSSCDHLPFNVFPEDPVPEELRLKYRYLDLRRTKLHKNIVLRSRVVSEIRKKMEELGFTEFQTPILTVSSPEGARDYLVPSRIHPGKFYALPQAPQQYKQLLMASGFDRYFQIAPCFRDEDARANRSPGEFYQLDIEMSFVEQDDIFVILENLLFHIFSKFSSFKVTNPPFPRIKYRDAMLKYGCDKPDLRNPLEIIDVTDNFRNSGFQAFSKAVENKSVVRAIAVQKISDKPRSFFDNMVEYAQSIGSKGLAYLVWQAGEVKGPIAKFLDKERIESLAKAGNITDGDVMFFICHSEKEAIRLCGDIRIKLGAELGLVEKDVFKFCWVVDFPMYEIDETSHQIVFSHNPFSMPQGGMDALKTKNPLDIMAFQYDIVCNGIEISSGAIRNHVPEIMYEAFKIAGYPPSEVDKKFPAMIEAFRFGTPPHGGIAPGIDRMIMLLADEANLREVIAFPLNQKAQDLLMDSPREVTEKQLKELHLKIAQVTVNKKE